MSTQGMVTGFNFMGLGCVMGDVLGALGGRFRRHGFCTHPPCNPLVEYRGGGVVNQPLIRRGERGLGGPGPNFLDVLIC